MTFSLYVDFYSPNSYSHSFLGSPIHAVHPEEVKYQNHGQLVFQRFKSKLLAFLKFCASKLPDIIVPSGSFVLDDNEKITPSNELLFSDLALSDPPISARKN